MFEELIKLCPNFKDIDCDAKLIYMLTAEGEMSILVAKFTKKHLS